MTKQELLIDKKVASFREKFGIKDSDPIDLHRLLYKLNIFTVFKPLSENFSGMAFKLNNLNSILVNSNQSIGRQNFTIGHELYHLFVQDNFKPHRCNPGFSTSSDKEEKNADSFASKLLMPNEGILEYISEAELRKDSIKIETILRLEQIYEVSHSALLYRLKDLDLITITFIEANKNGISQTARKYGFDTTLYKPGNQDKIIGDYGIKANQAFNEEKISEGHLNELMDIFNHGEEE